MQYWIPISRYSLLMVGACDALWCAKVWQSFVVRVTCDAVWRGMVVLWCGMIVWWYGGHFIAVWTENGLVSVANPGEARFFNALFKPELVAVLRVVDPGGCGILLETPYILSFLEDNIS